MFGYISAAAAAETAGFMAYAVPAVLAAVTFLLKRKLDKRR